MEVNKIIEPYLDLGNLLLIDRDPIEELSNIDQEKLKQLTQKNVQFMFNKIAVLPRKIVKDAACVHLPECEYILPREKPIPKPKEPTKWEKFAKSKGIVKLKRSKKVWDEAAQDWKPRYGYRRANDEKNSNWLIEIPYNADPNKDYFAEKADAKREQQHKQEFQRLKNVARVDKNAVNSSRHPSLPPLVSQTMAFKQHEQRQQKSGIGRKNSTHGDDSKLLGLIPVEKKSKEQIIHQLSQAKKATASMGQFQPTLKGEKALKGKGIKRKFEPNEGNVTEERKHQIEILKRLESKRPKLVEERIEAVYDHIKKEEKRKSGSDLAERNIDGKRRGKTGKSSRSKSKIDRQQRFQHLKKQTKKSSFKSARSKARKAGSGKGRK